MEDNLNKIEPTSFDNELTGNVELSKVFRLGNPAFYFSLIEEKLTIVGSMAVGGYLLCKMPESESNKLWPKLITDCLLAYFETNNIALDSEVTIVGDNMINYAYSMPSGSLIKNAWDFFSIPQDTYVITCNHAIFFQYTYEDELYVYNTLESVREL
jgi:hypothetical protein